MALTIEEIYQLVENDQKNLETMTKVLLKFVDIDILLLSGELVLRDNLTPEEENEIRVAYNKYRAAPYDWYYHEDSDVLPRR
ncbi:MAG TPA: hypothetical protein PK443_06460 [bacterium]|nr:hypothetical protein [bacterium]